jgi:hypothetical protein
MNAWAITLFNPRFWEIFHRSVPPFDFAMEDRKITALSNRAKMSEDRIRELMDGYLRIRHAERNSMVHPGNSTGN